jgi:hypothetical protein
MVEQPQWRSAFRRGGLRGCGSAARFDGKLSTRSRYYTTARKGEEIVSAGVPVYFETLRLSRRGGRR